MERTRLQHELFDHRYPCVRDIQEKYKRVKDLSEMKGLTRADIADAVLHLGPGQYLILPELGWERDVYSNPFRRLVVPLYTPARFRKFAPEINIVKSGISLRQISERNLTPRKAFRLLNEQEVRERLEKRNYRGIGWWSPRSRRHNIIWFDVLAEGQEYARFFEDDFDTEYLFADAYQYVPSFRKGRVYITPLKVLPVTPGQFCIEWLETFAQCGCEDAFYMGAKTRKKAGDEYETLYKYANPEQIICRHNWAQRVLVEKASEDGRMPLKQPIKWPRATGLLNYWLNLKTKTLIRKGKRLRRPLKIEINILCGNGIGYAGADYMLELSE